MSVLHSMFVCFDFLFIFFFFFNDTATTEIYTLPLHDALPICEHADEHEHRARRDDEAAGRPDRQRVPTHDAQHYETHRIRSEEHTSELQSLAYLVCRLLLEKKKKQ